MEQYNMLEYGNANETIIIGKTLLFGVGLSGDGANADLQLHDGANATAPQKVHLEALSGTTNQLVFPEGVLFKNGIHVVVNASTSKYAIDYLPIGK